MTQFYICFNNLSFSISGYFALNVSGVWFYNVTPIGIYIYDLWWRQKEDAQIGYVWVSWYPFDKHKLIGHIAVYIFEVFAGKEKYNILSLLRIPFYLILIVLIVVKRSNLRLDNDMHGSAVLWHG